MAAVLTVEGLAKSFSGVRALDGVDVEVHEGEILGLVGPNGSGKTTLFNCITGFVRPTSGTVLWKGRNITQLAPDQIARLGVVRTFQQKMVFPRATVRENVEMAWRGKRRGGTGQQFKSCDDLLDFLGLAHLKDRLATDIPFGSARNLGLGLALAANPRLLLLDEPAGGLNQDEGQELADLIVKIGELGITVWVIEHDMPFIMSLCERIIVLHCGKRIAEGRPTEVANDPNVISVFLGEKFAKDSAT
ncbi:MAG: ABC transporter ATP-binding protein [Chloroflexi bacterium]|nr:ABC transporter ATP-binding protein [Chloroflexota bacterium]